MGMNEDRFADEMYNQMKENKEITMAFKTTFAQLQSKQQEKVMMRLVKILLSSESSTAESEERVLERSKTSLVTVHEDTNSRSFGRSKTQLRYEETKAQIAENVIFTLDAHPDVLASLSEKVKSKVEGNPIYNL